MLKHFVEKRKHELEVAEKARQNKKVFMKNAEERLHNMVETNKNREAKLAATVKRMHDQVIGTLDEFGAMYVSLCISLRYSGQFSLSLFLFLSGNVSKGKYTHMCMAKRDVPSSMVILCF